MLFRPSMCRMPAATRSAIARDVRPANPTGIVKKMLDKDRVFTARCYASAVYAMALCLSACVCVCLCLCLSVTSRSSTKTAKRRITQTTPHDTPGSLVFWCQRLPRNSTGVTPYRGHQMQVGWVKIGDFRQITGYISKMVQGRRTVSIKVE